MKVTQQNIKSFDFTIDNEEEFINYFDKNEPFLKGHLMILRGDISANIRTYLEVKKVPFVDASDEEKLVITTKKQKNVESFTEVKEVVVERIIEKVVEKIVEVEKTSDIENRTPLSVEPLYFNRPIRSGEAINHNSDITIFGRINSGAKVIAQGNVKVFGIIEGIIESHGDYIVLNKIGAGSVYLKNERLDSARFSNRTILVTIKDKTLEYKELS
jgi:septum site-determining protein MinC